MNNEKIPTPGEIKQRNDYEKEAEEIVNKEGLSKNEIIIADAKMENYMRNMSPKFHGHKEQLERLQKSSLTLEHLRGGNQLLRGRIEGGKIIEIEASVSKDEKLEIIRANVNNQSMSDEEAKELWFDWYYAGENRMRGIAAYKHEKDQK